MARYVDEEHVAIRPMSKEFYEIIDTILNSEYYTSDPDEACILIPPIDTLNENNLRKEEIAKALAMLPQWVCYFYNVVSLIVTTRIFHVLKWVTFFSRIFVFFCFNYHYTYPYLHADLQTHIPTYAWYLGEKKS